MRVGTMWWRLGVLVSLVALASCGQLSRYQQTSRAEKLVRAQLTDPDSAKFDQETFNEVRLTDGGRVVTFCGNLNSKNQFGGYTGAHPFIYVLARDLGPKDSQNDTPYAAGSLTVFNLEGPYDILKFGAVCGMDKSPMDHSRLESAVVSS